MHDWQPIDSAPRDGSFILACRPGWDRPVVARWKHNTRLDGYPQFGLPTHYFGDPEEDDDLAYARDEPLTLWMPIPPVPTEEICVSQQKPTSR